MTDYNVQALDRFGDDRIKEVREVCRHHGEGKFSTNDLLAIGLRETWLQNEVGDFGHGRGVLQEDDRFQAAFLQSTRGCADGSYEPTFDSALPAGRVPTLKAGAKRAIEILLANRQYGAGNGVRDHDLKRFAVAAYNAGPGGAIAGYRAGNVDQNTAGGNYSRDVYARRKIVASYLKGRR